MKRIFVILLVFIAYSQAVLSQNDINGVYEDDLGRQIEISENKFTLRQFRYAGIFRFFQNDIYAETTYEWVNDKFIQLRNIQNAPPLADIKYFEWKRKHASNVKVTVILPDIEGREVDVRMSYYSLKDNLLITRQKKYDNKNHRATFFIPLDQNMIHIQVRPKQLYPLLRDMGDKLYNSFIQYDTSLSLYLEKDRVRAKYIEVIIPGIDDGYFGRYYINGDYVRVDGDKLYWRGRVFEKSTDPDDIEYISRKSSENK